MTRQDFYGAGGSRLAARISPAAVAVLERTPLEFLREAVKKRQEGCGCLGRPTTVHVFRDSFPGTASEPSRS